MKTNLTIWDKLTGIVLLLLVIAILVGVGIWYAPVIRKNEAMRRDKLELDQKIEKEAEAGKKLDASLKALQDPRTVERLAREKLSYAKPGETVVHFESPPTNTTSSAR